MYTLQDLLLFFLAHKFLLNSEGGALNLIAVFDVFFILNNILENRQKALQAPRRTIKISQNSLTVSMCVVINVLILLLCAGITEMLFFAIRFAQFCSNLVTTTSALKASGLGAAEKQR